MGVMKLTFKIANLSAQGGNGVQVTLTVSGDAQGLPGPNPTQLTIYVPEQLGDELELGETFEMEIKADKP
jgi:hypothetical protein